MEAFSLLKYWKGGAAGAPTLPSAAAAAQDTTAILAAVPQNDIETTTDDDDDEDGNDDDGSFFDLELAVPNEEANDDSEDAHENPNEDDDYDNNDESGSEFKLSLSPSTGDRTDPDDLFFKGKLVQLEPSSFVLNSSEPNSKPQPQLTGSLLKSATKFRVFMLGLKKSKSNVASDKDSSASDSAPKQQEPEPQQQRKLFTVKFKVEEVPIVSLFTRDNSSRGATSNKPSQKQKQQESQSQSQSPSSSSASDEKQRFSKEVMHKYLKKVKPLYVRVSRRYAEKLRFSGQLNIPPPKPAPAKAAAEKAQTEADASESGGNNTKVQKQGNLPLPAGLRVVCKHLGKSRSASASVPAAEEASVSSRRRDDSLLQQQDGIQSAILHCKRSFNASRECESSQLPRSVSDPLHEISPELSRKSTNDVKEKRL